MILLKRIIADVRGPGQSAQEVENIVCEKLITLQTNANGELNTEIEIRDIKEITKDSGVSVFLIIYDDKGLNTKKAQ